MALNGYIPQHNNAIYIALYTKVLKLFTMDRKSGVKLSKTFKPIAISGLKILNSKVAITNPFVFKTTKEIFLHPKNFEEDRLTVCTMF